MKRLFLVCSRLSARMGWWTMTVASLVYTGPLPSLAVFDRGRLSYALLLSRRSGVSQALFVRLLKRDFGKDAAIDLEIAEMAMRLGNPSLGRDLLLKVAQRDKGAAGTVAATMYRYITQILDGTVSATFNQQIEALDLGSGSRVTVITLSGHYLEMFELWKEQALKYVDRRFLVIALDTKAVEVASQLECCRVLDISPYFLFDANGKINPHSRHLLWVLRSLILKTLLERGHTVYSMDIDAVPVTDLDAMLATLPQADIVAQEDFSIPMDVARKQGFILCCGFMILHPTAATLAFMKRFTDQVILELDDQLALNHQIAEAGITNMETQAAYRRFTADGAVIVCPDKQRVSRDVSYGTVVRHFQQRNESIAELRQKLEIA
ncbi:glycosyltransferase family 77 protein [Terriglobus albidus]|uniref:glycosyltransferase family 77 protein n=1 Tax=Terriglobus albidus TaxID=1592106 RepID=UPI0021DF75A3|nr:glycosyltransferase family 77 protein [Terriglobus albidus]